MSHEHQVQIFGIKKSKETRAAERFFKERKIKVHFVDLNVRPISQGELQKFVQKFGLHALLDTDSKAYEQSHLAYLRISEMTLIEKIQENPELLRLPLTRCKSQLSIGNTPDIWKAWLS